MARDVEFNVTASDKTGSALAEAERKLKAAQERIRRDSKTTGDGFGKSLLDGITKVSPKLGGFLTSTFATAGKASGPLLAAGIAAATPLIGASVSAAVIGGAGVGGVIGGVLLASRDARVRAAGERVGKTFLDALSKDASVFIGPVLDQITKIEARFEQMRGRIRNIFSNSVGFLGPLVDGALTAVDGVLKGFESLTANGRSTMQALGQSVGLIGQAIGAAFQTIAGGSEDAAAAVRFLGVAMATSVELFGRAVRILTELFGVMLKGAGPALDLAAKMGLISTSSQQADQSTTGAGHAFTFMAQQATAASQASVDYAAAAAGITSANRSLYGSQTAAAQAIADSTKKIEENGRGLDINTQKGRNNRATLEQLANSLGTAHDKYVQVNGSGAKSNAIMSANRAEFIRAARAAGAAADKAEALADELLGIKSRTVSVNVVFNESRINAVENRLNRMGGSMYNAAGDSWAALDSKSGTARTGGPTPVSVSNNVSVALDGAPFRAMTVQAVQASERRQAWRAKVGAR